jgi:hypothetical protein
LGEAWFTGVADELARCLVDARHCAEACEAFLESLQERGDLATQRSLVDALVAPAAVARVLIELIDHPPELVLAAARLCRDAAQQAVARLADLQHEETAALVAALHRAADSCERLLETDLG